MHQLVGIDVSAKTLAIALEPEGRAMQRLQFANTPAGHRKLIQRLTKSKRTARVALEATGSYSFDLALALHRSPRVEVMVVNPKAAAHFAKACLQRLKNDPEDAAILLEFVRRMDFTPWQAPTAQGLELKALSRRIAALTKFKTQEKNRLHAVNAVAELSAAVRRDIEVSIRHVERRLERLRAQALQLIAKDPDLRRSYALIISAKGIAAKSGIQILAELCTLPETMKARQWVAHAGIDPRQILSGTSVSKPARISKAGNVYLRRALYMPALVASQHEPGVKRYYNRLLERGKAKLQALVAVMRKLLHAIHGMLKNDQPFDGRKFCSPSPVCA